MCELSSEAKATVCEVVMLDSAIIASSDRPQHFKRLSRSCCGSRHLWCTLAPFSAWFVVTVVSEVQVIGNT